MNGKARRIAGTTLIILGGLVLVGSATSKLAHVPQVVSQMNALGFSGEKLTFIGILELLSGLLFLLPGTRSAGLLLVSSYLGGAIATHLQHGEPILPPSIVLTVLWLGAWLRHPVIVWNAATNGQPAIGERRAAQLSSQP